MDVFIKFGERTKKLRLHNENKTQQSDLTCLRETFLELVVGDPLLCEAFIGSWGPVEKERIYFKWNPGQRPGMSQVLPAGLLVEIEEDDELYPHCLIEAFYQHSRRRVLMRAADIVPVEREMLYAHNVHHTTNGKMKNPPFNAETDNCRSDSPSESVNSETSVFRAPSASDFSLDASNSDAFSYDDVMHSQQPQVILSEDSPSVAGNSMPSSLMNNAELRMMQCASHAETSNDEGTTLRYPTGLPELPPELLRALADNELHFKRRLFMKIHIDFLFEQIPNPVAKDIEAYARTIVETYPVFACRRSKKPWGPFRVKLAEAIYNRKKYKGQWEERKRKSLSRYHAKKTVKNGSSTNYFMEQSS